MAWFLLGLFVRREVADHGYDPDRSSGIIPKNGPMDTHPYKISVFANATFLNGPGVGLAAEYTRKFSHVPLAIVRVSKADVGLGQQFFRRIPKSLPRFRFKSVFVIS